MSLLAATLLVAGLALLVGGLLLVDPPGLGTALRRSLRSPAVTLALLVPATAWFLFHVYHLGESDFGQFRIPLMVLFGGIAVGAWFHVRDFLAVRALAILMLLAASPLLDAAFLRPPAGRLVLVTGVYVGIVVALVLGAAPYRARDAIDCLWAPGHRGRVRLAGAVVLAWAVALGGAALTY